MPDTTRWFDLEGVARYFSVRPTAIPRLVRLGRIPKPDHSLGKRSPRWDRELLDKMAPSGPNGAVDATKSMSITEASRANGKEILKDASRSRRSLH